MLCMRVLGEALHQLVHEVAVVHRKTAVDRVQRIWHAQGVHLHIARLSIVERTVMAGRALVWTWPARSMMQACSSAHEAM